MAKKKGKKNINAQRSARDIQTPFSDRETSAESDAEKANTSKTTERNEAQQTTLQSESPQRTANEDHSETKGDETSKENVRKARFDRSPTRKGDYAANAGHHESHDEEYSNLSDASSEDPPEEHQMEPLSGWVKDIIQKETSMHSKTIAEEFFTSDNPNYQECQKFFQQLNQKIRAANEQNDVNDLDIGTIPEQAYNGLCQTWQEKAKIALENNSAQDFWDAFNHTHHILKLFNNRHSLPLAWNISQKWAEKRVGAPNPSPVNDASIDSTVENGHSSSKYGKKDLHEELSDVSDSNTQENVKTGLDALEARTIKQQRQLRSAEVLFWWPKGTGSQTFVRYGGKTPIYRIRAGSHEIYNKAQTQRVLTSQTRGSAKVSENKDGLPGERWAYTRDDVVDIIGIGWKVEDDDEEGFDPLDLLRPAKGTTYPHTRALVTWKDGSASLEGRAFLRRITTGSALDGDRVIYQKAKEHEVAYREKYRSKELDDGAHDESDHGTESDSSVSSRRARSRRHHTVPTSSSNSAKKKSRHQLRYETSGSSETDSDSSSQAQNNYRIRNRSEPVSRRKKERSDEALIKKLEREIQVLKLGRSLSPEGKLIAQRRPQRRGYRERSNR